MYFWWVQLLFLEVVFAMATFVFQHSMQLIPKAKESLIGFSCSVLCFYEICVIGSVLLLLLPLTKRPDNGCKMIVLPILSLLSLQIW